MAFEQTVKNLDNCLRTDKGCTSELDYVEQTSWILFLKYLDDLEKSRKLASELQDIPYTPIIAEGYRWNDWAMPRTKTGEYDTSNALVGDDLIEFVNGKLFPYLRKFRDTGRPKSIEVKIGVNNGLFVIAAGGKWQSDGWDKELLPVLKEDKEKYLVGAKWGLIDAHGKLVVETFADFMQVISEEKVTFRIGEKYGILDLKSNERILTDYDYLLSFHEGRCISGKFNERKSLLFGYIKDDGSELVPCLYTKAYNFENGEGHLESGPDCDVVDLNGKVIASYSDRDSYDPSQNYDWARETWYALTDGQYGDYPGPGTDFDALFDALGY